MYLTANLFRRSLYIDNSVARKNAHGALRKSLRPAAILIPKAILMAIALSLVVVASAAAGTWPGSNEANAATPDSFLCTVNDTTLCLSGGRFQVQATWDTGSSSGQAHMIQYTSDTGFLWFFANTNIEAVVKVLNACAPPFNRFWFFAGGLTNVKVTIIVTDSQLGSAKTYINPQGTAFAPIQDTGTFPCS
jgi:hypothetical protein